MSRIANLSITCPKCRLDFETPVYTEIDAVIDPDLADDAVSGKLFETTCPKCGFTEEMLAPCLYADFEKNTFVYYMTNPQEEHLAFEFILERRRKLPVESPEVTRLVSSMEEFKEKILIFRSGFDDRIVEYIKYQLADRFMRCSPDCNGVSAQIVKADDGSLRCALTLSSGELFFAEFDDVLYNTAKGELAGRVFLSGDPVHVNRGWVTSMLSVEDSAKEENPESADAKD